MKQLNEGADPVIAPSNLQAPEASNSSTQTLSAAQLEQDEPSLQAQLEEANLARQKQVEKVDQLAVQVETLQRQLNELIEAKVGLEKDKKQLLAGSKDICSTPAQVQGCSTPQSSIKRSSRSFTGAHLEDWEKLQLRIHKAERALEHERMATSELRRLVDSQRAAALAGQVAHASHEQLLAELATARQESIQKQQQADALRAAVSKGDQTVAELRQQLAEAMQARRLTCDEEGGMQQKIKEAEKAADERCLDLAALVDQLMQENLDLGTKLNAKSNALAQARADAAQKQTSLEAALAKDRRHTSSGSICAQSHECYTAITIGDAASSTSQTRPSVLPGGLTDVQWQLLMLNEEVTRLKQQLAMLRGEAADGSKQGAAASSSNHSLQRQPQPQQGLATAQNGNNSSVTKGALDGNHFSNEWGSGALKEGGVSSTTTPDPASSREAVAKGSHADQMLARGQLGGTDTANGTASSTAEGSLEGSISHGLGVYGGVPPKSMQTGPSSSISTTSCALEQSKAGLGIRQQRMQPSKPVELQLPPAQLQQRVSELAAVMLELEEQVEEELAKQKQQPPAVHEQQQTQQQPQGMCEITPAAVHRHDLISGLHITGTSSQPQHTSIGQHHQHHHQHPTQQQQQQDHSDQPQMSAAPSNLWERRLSRAKSHKNLASISHDPQQEHTSTAQEDEVPLQGSQIVLFPNVLSVDVGDGASTPHGPPLVQQLYQPQHSHQQRSSPAENDDSYLDAEVYYDDEEMLMGLPGKAKGAGRSSGRMRKGGWDLWSWLAGGS